MPTVHTWVVMLTVDALPDDEQQLQADLPTNAQVLVGSLATGVLFRIRSHTLTRAHAVALNAMTDVMPRLSNTPVTSMQVYRLQDWERLVLNVGGEPFASLLYGLPERLTDRLSETMGALALTDGGT